MPIGDMRDILEGADAVSLDDRQREAVAGFQRRSDTNRNENENDDLDSSGAAA
jgi:hypothetical protein